MVTKRNLIGIAIAALLSILGLILTFNGNTGLGNSLLSLGGLAAFFFGLIMLLAESSIIGTIYWKIILVTWFGSNILWFLSLIPNFNVLPLVIGVLAIYFGTYCIWFFKKEKKAHLDYLKLFWVLNATLIPIGVTFKLLPSKFIYAADIVFWIMIVDFLFIAFKSKKGFAKN